MPSIPTPILETFFSKDYQKPPTIYSYLKVYPDQAKHIEYLKPYNQIAYYDEAMKSAKRDSSRSKPRNLSESENAEILLLESLRRSKTTISDIVLSNKFDMWCTFTFNGKLENQKKLGLRATTDRYDVDLCKKKMSVWFNNQRRLHGRFEYLIVPEFHKDGALHFHAFFNNYKGTVVPTGTTKHSKKVYRIKSYQLGISEMQKIGQTDTDYKKISSYIKKYITKDMPMFSGKKRYWCSKDLIRPDIIKNPEQTQLQKYSFEMKRRLQHLTISRGTLIV